MTESEPGPWSSPIARAAARYGLAFGSVSVAFLLVLRFTSELEPHTYAVFLFAIVATALFGGLGPALTATALALVATNSIDVIRLGGMRLDLIDLLQVAIFATIAVSISVLTTKRQRAERELERANAELRELDRAKDRFIATVSHELRTPVTVILGWAAILRQPDAEEIRSTAAEAIEQSARAQARLIEDLLDMSRLTIGKLRLEIAPVALVSAVQQSVEMIRPAAATKGVALTVGFPAEPCVVDGDPTRLQQICWNLLSNALKFTPPGGRIDVRLTHDDGSAQLTISDTGEGIGKELLPRVFEPLRQARGAAAKGGLGLGLAIVRQLVSMHGGTIEAESAGEGRGARFTVRLPMAVPSALPNPEDGKHEA